MPSRTIFVKVKIAYALEFGGIMIGSDFVFNIKFTGVGTRGGKSTGDMKDIQRGL